MASEALIQQLLKQMADQQAQLADQQAQMKDLINKFSSGTAPSAPVDTKQQLIDSIYRRTKEFNFVADNGETFDVWFKRYEDIFEEEGSALDDKARTRLLVSRLDSQAHARFTGHILPQKPADLDWDTTKTTLLQLFGPKKTLFRRRFECLKTTFHPNGDINNYANTINSRCEDAEFKNISIDAIKCLFFVSGFQAPELADHRTRLLRKLDQSNQLTLQDLVNEYQLMESYKEDARTIENQPRHVHAVYQKKKKPFKQHYTSSDPPSPCPNCGQNHWKKNCPSLQATGNFKESHRSNGSRTKTNGQRHSQCKNIVAKLSGDARRYLDITINGHLSRLQIDTGADITLISRSTWKDLGRPRLEPSSASIKAANGTPLKINGYFDADFAIKDNSGRAHPGRGHCYVTDDDECNLVGITWITQVPEINDVLDKFHVKKTYTLDLDRLREGVVDKLKTDYADVFEPGLGCCTKTKATLYLKPDVLPTFIKKRPVPYAVTSKLDDEIDRLLGEGVISPVDHSHWAAPIVVVKKSNGSIRLCADFSTGLNDSLMLHQHPLPTAEDIFTKLNGGTVFSQIDFADAYLQVEVNDNSKELLTINTHRGLFRYNRLPFGVKSAPGIFQQIIDSMISGLSGVAAYLDDVIVTGRTIEEHNAHLEALFKRILNFGFRVRLNKCNFVMPQITYLGNIIDSHGRHPDPKKIKVIQQMPHPTNIAQVRSFLGLINYYGSFVSEMRQLRAPLDALLKKDTPFNWSTECQAAFERAKEVLASDLLLTHYDPNQDIIVAADASDYGIGAVISHRFKDGSEKAIFHASRSLTDAEKNYGQIEKEGLALIFAVRKFHRYIHGRRFTLLTDHKPLLAIFGSKKGVPVYTANRLQRWCLTLLGYNFTIEYRKTTSFGQADALSRLIASQTAPEEDIVIAKIEEDVAAVISTTLENLPVTANDIAKATLNDHTLHAVFTLVQSGQWPKKPEQRIARYACLRQSLSVQNGCVFFGSRVVIPFTLQQRVLKSLHEGHPRMN